MGGGQPSAPAEQPAQEEEPLGSSLIGESEGPDIITDESQFPTKFSEVPMVAEQVVEVEPNHHASCHRAQELTLSGVTA